MGWRAWLAALYPWAKVSTGTSKEIALDDPKAMAQDNLYVVVDRNTAEA